MAAPQPPAPEVTEPLVMQQISGIAPGQDKPPDGAAASPATPGIVLTPQHAQPAPAKVGDTNAAPTTTAAQDITATRQSTINFIWEAVQAIIALSVVGTTLWVSQKISQLMVVVGANEAQAAAGSLAFMLLSNLASLIIGFYFGRTNHTKTGGAGEPQHTTR